MEFEDERQLQIWVREMLSKYGGLEPLIVGRVDVETFNREARCIAENYHHCLPFLVSNRIITEDRNIGQEDGEILRPDFVLSSLENCGVVIVELKNRAKATREAGTELGAYSAAVRSVGTISSESDCIRVIISTEWPTLLRKYVYNEVVRNSRHVLCLTPIWLDEGFALSIINPDVLCPKSLGNADRFNTFGCQVCLYDVHTYSKEYDRTRLDKFVTLMRHVLDNIKSFGERMCGNGFAFLWRDHTPGTLSRYNITLINAFANKVDQFEDQRDNQSEQLTDAIFDAGFDAESFLFSPIVRAMINMINDRLKSDVDVQAECPNTWNILGWIMEVRSRGDLLSFHGWGEFGNKFDEIYGEQLLNGVNEYPMQRTDIGLQLVEQMTSF